MYVCALLEVLAGSESVQLALWPGAPAFAPVHDVTAPQLLFSVTLPPLDGSDVGLALTEHAGLVVPPEQLIETLLN
jgi:hypothetical protein